MTRVPMTKQGAERMRQELDILKREERPKIVKAIAEARAHGDLRENAEYHAAKEKQGFIEARIRDFEEKLANVQIIDVIPGTNSDTVVFGATVHLINIETNAEVTYQIVGEYEADIKSNKISISSPVARAVIGKKLDDEVQVQTPSGIVTYEITEIEYI